MNLSIFYAKAHIYMYDFIYRRSEKIISYVYTYCNAHLAFSCYKVVTPFWRPSQYIAINNS